MTKDIIGETLKTLFEYQQDIDTYSKGYDRDTSFIHLMEEVGEVAKIVSKVKRGGGIYFTLEEESELAYELGDVLATLTMFANHFGWSLEALARMNVKKLKFREGIDERKGT